MSNKCRIDAKLTPEKGRARRIQGWGPGGLYLINLQPSQLSKLGGASLLLCKGTDGFSRGRRRKHRQGFPRCVIHRGFSKPVLWGTRNFEKV